MPNAVGIVLGATQVLVFFIYMNSSSSRSTRMMADEGSSDIVKEGTNMQHFGEDIEDKV